MSANLSPAEKEQLFLEAVEGLTKKNKQLPSKLFYDERGSQLFDEITRLDEYYITRTELQIMENNIEEISSLLGEGTLLIELGSGSSIKIRLLLENIPGLAGYVPIDISSEHLFKSSGELKNLFPHIDIFPVVADYTQDFYLPEIEKDYDHRAVYYPGSTIGNFKRDEAKMFLCRIAKLCGSNGGAIIGVDLVKDKKILEAAYNDKKGVTAAFNLNILNHLNNIFNTNFDLKKFRHYAFFNDAESRIEMHLVSEEDQDINLNGINIHFKKDESILTEFSNKYTIESFANLASEYFNVKKVWMDKNRMFSIQYLRVK